MPRTINRAIPVEEVKSLHCAPLAAAKAKVARAVTSAIGDQPLKAFGHEGLMSGICSGEKVPDYLARIVQDKRTRHRFAVALVQDDTDVIVTVTFTNPK